MGYRVLKCSFKSPRSVRDHFEVTMFELAAKHIFIGFLSSANGIRGGLDALKREVNVRSDYQHPTLSD